MRFSLLLLGSYVKIRLLESSSSPGSWNSPTVCHKQTNRFVVFLTFRMENERSVEREHNQCYEDDESTDSRKPPPWRKQITVRSIVASVFIGIVYSVICLKLNLTTGLVPNLNISSALLAFVFLKSWTKILQKAGIVTTPFTRQENTIAQTCAVACYSIALAGSFHCHKKNNNV